MNEDILADKEHFERAWLIGVQFPNVALGEVEEHLDELEALVDTMGAQVVGREVVKISKPNAKFLIGSGKVDETIGWLEHHEVDVVIFDDDLTPAQQKAWEKATKKAVIDRRKVIIDIFAQRAMTKEARLQIQLASLEYQLPRLKRAWTHLERQRGGGGFIGGAGEAQIETDRRLVRDQIAKLKVELKNVRAHREHQRKARQKRPVPNTAIVGYTNSGKSSLLNSMTKANVLQEDQLFATLDPTTRRVELTNNQQMLLTDTVGFIRKLPHTLVEAFKATLEEAATADYLVHVVDVTHPQVHEHILTTNKILDELGAADKPTLLVLNKIDLWDKDSSPLIDFLSYADKVIMTSAMTGEGLEQFRDSLGDFLNDELQELEFKIPASRYDAVSIIHREGKVHEEKYKGNQVHIKATFPNRFLHLLDDFIVGQLEEANQAS